MYKLVFIDIDGTLLTSQHTISKGTRAAIRRITGINNIVVVLTSARPPQAVKGLYDSLGLQNPVTCFNGALILENLLDENYSNPLRSITIDPELLGFFRNSLEVDGVNTSFYKSGEWFSATFDNWIKQEEEITGTKAAILNMDVQISNWIKKKEGPHKVLFMGEPVLIESIQEILRTSIGDRLNIYKSKPTYLEVSAALASKTAAVNFLMEKYSISREEVIAIGDNYNDIEMLQMAGLGIAMGNAPAAVKAQADFITLDNDSEGIQVALDRFIT
jgi:Cof subfamily protein (haloacid dehalogenase superfamily)